MALGFLAAMQCPDLFAAPRDGVAWKRDPASIPFYFFFFLRRPLVHAASYGASPLQLLCMYTCTTSMRARGAAQTRHDS